MLRRWSRWCANQDNRARLSAETWRKDATAQYRIQGSGVAPSSLPVPEGGHPQRTAPDTYAARVVRRQTPPESGFLRLSVSEILVPSVLGMSHKTSGYCWRTYF